jgi:hypothetical protein
MARISSLTQTLTAAGLLTALMIQPTLAAPMGPTQVRAMANSWAARSAGFQGAQVSNVQGLSWEAAEPAFYLVTLNQGGWMLTSGDDALRPVVGYSTQGLPSGELPPALLERLQAEEREVIALRAAGGSCTVALDAWTALLQNRGAESTALSTSPGDVEPMIEAIWGQGSLYNTDCPTDNAGPGGHAFVGCVGVAIAQVLDFWNWPEQGEFVQSYYHNIYGDITVDFNQEFYNWDAITPTEVNADVKELLYHAGVSVRMNYGPGGSTAQSSMISTALRAYFRYQDSARMVWRSSYTAETWRTMLQSELSAGRPVIYRGQGPNGGHAYNLDGVQDSTWFHINWGWSGNYNGYFLLDDLSPGNYYFGDVQGAVIGIAPDGMVVNHQPMVPAMYMEIQENQTASFTFSGYDVDGDALTYQVAGQPIVGNSWTFTPPANTHGTFSFTYQACDQSGCSQPADLIIVVHSVNQLPVVASLEVESLEDESLSVELAGFDADDDSLLYLVNGQAIAGSTFRWTPPSNASGDYSFSYTACDAAGCGESALLLVHVLPVNDAPQVTAVTMHITEPGLQQVQLSGWDVDSETIINVVDGLAVDGDIFEVEAVPGTDMTFDYYVTDGSLFSELVTITLTFAPKGPGKDLVEETNFSNRSQLTEGLAVELPLSNSLRPAYPNPFNPSTTLPFELAQTEHVRLSIYNVAGQRVDVLVDGMLEAGRHELNWTAGRLASGAYLAVLETSAGLSTQILQLVK